MAQDPPRPFLGRCAFGFSVKALRTALFSAVSWLRWFRILDSRLELGPLSVAAVSCVFSCSSSPYIDRSSKLTTFKGAVEMSQKREIGIAQLPMLESAPRLPGEESDMSAPHYTSI